MGGPGASGLRRAPRRDAGLPRRRRAGGDGARLRPGRPGPGEALETALAAAGFGSELSRVAARTLLHYVFGHTSDEQAYLQAGSAGAVDAEPRETSDFELGLALILDGLRLHYADLTAD